MRGSRVGRVVAGVAAVSLLSVYVLRPPGLIDVRGLALIYVAGLIAALGLAQLIRVRRKP